MRICVGGSVSSAHPAARPPDGRPPGTTALSSRAGSLGGATANDQLPCEPTTAAEAMRGAAARPPQHVRARARLHCARGRRQTCGAQARTRGGCASTRCTHERCGSRVAPGARVGKALRAAHCMTQTTDSMTSKERGSNHMAARELWRGLVSNGPKTRGGTKAKGTSGTTPACSWNIKMCPPPHQTLRSGGAELMCAAGKRIARRRDANLKFKQTLQAHKMLPHRRTPPRPSDQSSPLVFDHAVAEAPVVNPPNTHTHSQTCARNILLMTTNFSRLRENVMCSKSIATGEAFCLCAKG